MIRSILVEAHLAFNVFCVVGINHSVKVRHERDGHVKGEVGTPYGTNLWNSF